MTQGFYLVLIGNLFGIVIATAYYFTMKIIDGIKNNGLISIYMVSVAYTENDKLKVCEVPVGIMDGTPPISKMVFIQKTIREHISEKLKVYNSNPNILGVSYFGKIQKKELYKFVKEVVERS